MHRLLTLLILSGCAEPVLVWTENPCGNGDPVQIGCEDGDHVYEDASTDRCADLGVQAGDDCADIEEACVLEQAFTCASGPPEARSSEELLTCRDEPYSDDVVCPQSNRAAKRDIIYVGAEERRDLAKQVMDVKLARYTYIDPKKPGRKLGYILEDIPEAPFSGVDHVDLYAYISAVVALTQEQQLEIDRLRTELETLKVSAKQ